MENPSLIRRRLIPFETIPLNKDKILYIDENVIVTSWNVLRKRPDFSFGYSIYFLKDGYKISKFLDKNGRLVYYYCDIIEVEYNENSNTYVFTDLLADVIIYPNKRIEVVDLSEIPEAMEKGLITDIQIKSLLNSLDRLLKKLYAKNGLKMLIGDYFNKNGDIYGRK